MRNRTREVTGDPIGDQFERAICGAAMEYPDLLDTLEAIPEGRDFKLGGAADLWQAILQCRGERGKVITSRVIQLVKEFGFSDHDAADVIQLCAPEVARRSSAPDAARYLIARSLQRRAVFMAAEMVQTLENSPVHQTAELVGRFERQMTDLAHSADKADAWEFADAIEDVTDATISSGWEDLDKVIGGIPTGVLTVVAARPGMGKTAFAVAATRLLAKQGHGVGFFSLEMPNRDLLDRMACAEAYRPGVFMSGISDNPYYSTARRGELTPAQQRRFDEGMAEVQRLPIAFDGRKGLKIGKIKTAARRLQAAMARRGSPLVAIFVDHLQHIRPDIDRKGQRTSEVTDITGALMEIAAELGVAVVALSQLNREVEKRTDKRPTMADLRESGSIEQDAHTIIMLYRPAYYFEQARKAGESVNVIDEANSRNVLEANVVKQRNGPTETVSMFCEIGANAILDQKRRSNVRAA